MRGLVRVYATRSDNDAQRGGSGAQRRHRTGPETRLGLSEVTPLLPDSDRAVCPERGLRLSPLPRYAQIGGRGPVPVTCRKGGGYGASRTTGPRHEEHLPFPAGGLSGEGLPLRLWRPVTRPRPCTCRSRPASPGVKKFNLRLILSKKVRCRSGRFFKSTVIRKQSVPGGGGPSVRVRRLLG